MCRTIDMAVKVTEYTHRYHHVRHTANHVDIYVCILWPWLPCRLVDRSSRWCPQTISLYFVLLIYFHQRILDWWLFPNNYFSLWYDRSKWFYASLCCAVIVFVQCFLESICFVLCSRTSEKSLKHHISNFQGLHSLSVILFTLFCNKLQSCRATISLGVMIQACFSVNLYCF